MRAWILLIAQRANLWDCDAECRQSQRWTEGNTSPVARRTDQILNLSIRFDPSLSVFFHFFSVAPKQFSFYPQPIEGKSSLRLSVSLLIHIVFLVFVWADSACEAHRFAAWFFATGYLARHGKASTLTQYGCSAHCRAAGFCSAQATSKEDWHRSDRISFAKHEHLRVNFVYLGRCTRCCNMPQW